MLGLNKRRRRRWVNYIALRQVCRCNFLKFSKNLKHDAEKMQYLFSLSIGKKYIMHNYLLCIRLHFNLINNRIRGGTLWTFILGVAKGTWQVLSLTGVKRTLILVKADCIKLCLASNHGQRRHERTCLPLKNQLWTLVAHLLSRPSVPIDNGPSTKVFHFGANDIRR